VADYDIKQLQNGEVEETYAHAVAALTGNQDVVDAYKNYQVGQGIPNASDLAEDTEDVTGNASDDEDYSDDESNQTDSEAEEKFVKVPRTKEELEAEKTDKRTLRKANKKAVREEKTEKRTTKIKKKDKKRAIKKAKAGNTRK
jgi:RIO kinase 1